MSRAELLAIRAEAAGDLSAELSGALQMSGLIAAAARDPPRERGSHYREDHPEERDVMRHIVMRRGGKRARDLDNPTRVTQEP